MTLAVAPPSLRHAAPRDPDRPPPGPAAPPDPLPRRTPNPGTTAPAPPTEALLALLAEDPHASGVLLSGSGALYLRRGEAVHAESPAAPTLDALRTAGGDARRLPTGAWEIVHLAALFDAAYFTLAPDAGPIRFRPDATPWPDPIRPVAARAVARECRRRRALLDRAFPDPRLDASPVLRRPGVPPPRTALRRAILGHADGTRTPGAIAHLLGRPAFHVLAEVRRMAAAGLVAPPPPDPGPPAPPAWPATEPPDIELLRRIRDALEARL